MATDLETSVAELIVNTNIVSDIINEDATTEVPTSNGPIPSLRKALADNVYFQDPLPWSNGTNETEFNQLRTFTDGTVWWSPSATTVNPVPMGVTPIGDSNWFPFQDRNLRNTILEEVTRFNIKGTFAAGFIYETVDDVGLDNSGNPWTYTGSLPFTVPAGTTPTSPTYREESFSNHNAKTDRDHVGAHDTIYVRELTSSQILTNSELGEASIGTRYRITDLGNARYNVVASTDTGGYYFGSVINNKRLRLQIPAPIVKAVQFGVNGSSTDAAIIQQIYNLISNYSVVDFNGLSPQCDSIITLNNKNAITTIGGNWHWNHQGLNMIQLTGTLVSPTFLRMVVRGNDDAFISQGAIGCPSGTITENWTIDDCEFREMPFGAYVNADTAGSHKAPTVKNSYFKNMKRFANDSQSGAGNGLVFASNAVNGGGTIVGGVSQNNTFERCERHSLYVSDGGQVTSINDTFLEHRLGMTGTMPVTLAALQIARNAYNSNVITPTFKDCNDLCLAIQGIQTNSAPTSGRDVNVISPSFDGNKAGLIRLGNDSPTVNGWINDIIVTDINIIHYGETNNVQIEVFSGHGHRIKGVIVESNTSRGTTTLVNIVRIYDNATVDQFDDLVIEDMRGEVAGSTSRGVSVDDDILTGTYKVTLSDINVGTTPIREVVTLTNPNYRVFYDNISRLTTQGAFNAAFLSTSSIVNTQDKFFGKQLFSRSLNRPVFASGPQSSDTWLFSDGTTAYTPT